MASSQENGNTDFQSKNDNTAAEMSFFRKVARQSCCSLSLLSYVSSHFEVNDEYQLCLLPQLHPLNETVTHYWCTKSRIERWK